MVVGWFPIPLLQWSQSWKFLSMPIHQSSRPSRLLPRMLIMPQILSQRRMPVRSVSDAQDATFRQMVAARAAVQVKEVRSETAPAEGPGCQSQGQSQGCRSEEESHQGTRSSQKARSGCSCIIMRCPHYNLLDIRSCSARKKLLAHDKNCQ